jgi:hypothetical protein
MLIVFSRYLTVMHNAKIHRLIERALAIHNIPAQQDDSLTFMARIMAQATLPHRDPGAISAWGRTNGDASLTIQPGIEWVNGRPKSIGLPYGSIPRLLISWVTAEAVRTKSRELCLGDTLSEFMAELDLMPTGGRWGTITRLKDQMRRLFSARIIFQSSTHQYESAKEFSISKERLLWWGENHPNQPSFLKSYILLDQDFYEEIIKHPVPLDFRVLRELKQSPLALDLYVWLTYRMSYLKKTTYIPWTNLQQQFGSDYKDTDNFVRKAKVTLKKIKLFYPDLNIDEARGRLILLPSKTHISRKPSNVDKNED